MKAYVIFHHNLLYSSIPEAHFEYVVREIYARILDFAADFRLGLEFNGWTLERIADIWPEYVDRLRRLVEEGRVEVVASSYTQSIFPLVPYEVNRRNVELGLKVFEEILGIKPSIFLLNEMAYSIGAVEVLSEFGFEAFVFDWVNAVKSNEAFEEIGLWDAVENRGMRVVWADTYMTQRFQRFVWGELDEEDYRGFVKKRLEMSPRWVPVYVGDAEVFEYVPGSLIYTKGGRDIERIKLAFEVLKDLGLEPVLPSQVLGGPAREVEIATPDYPVRVKKQDKYNLTRWAVTGRDSSKMNAQCHRLFGSLRGKEDEELWRNLCVLWGSDFRTNTTDEKYLYFRNLMGYSLHEAKKRHGDCEGSSFRFEGDPRGFLVGERGRYVEVEGGCLSATLVKNKGLVLKRLVLKELGDSPLVGTVEHGFYDDVSYGADFFSFHMVVVTKDGRQLTELSCDVDVDVHERDGVLEVVNASPMELGGVSLIKSYRFGRWVEVVYKMYFRDIYPMCVRLGMVTAIPTSFDRDSFFFGCHNGGRTLELFYPRGKRVLMDVPVNYVVTSRGCLGATEGIFVFGDAAKAVAVSTDKALSYTVPLVRYDEVGDTFFFRVYHSMCERDEVANVFFKGYVEARFRVYPASVEGAS